MSSNQLGPALRVLQITDPHLMADPDARLLGVPTRESLAAVLEVASQDPVAADVVLATGDLSQDGSVEAYKAFAHSLAGFGAKVSWLPGNHDDTATLKAVAADFEADERQIIAGGWQIVMLDSSVHANVHGRLSDTELAFLDQSLSEHPERPAMVALHHHPVSVDCDWLEDIGLRNASSFWDVIDRHPQVKIVLWGHVHQEIDRQRGSVRLLSTPSTCVQFMPASADFGLEPIAPGYRWLNLYGSGDFETGVVRAESYAYELDLSSNGY